MIKYHRLFKILAKIFAVAYMQISGSCCSLKWSVVESDFWEPVSGLPPRDWGRFSTTLVSCSFLGYLFFPSETKQEKHGKPRQAETVLHKPPSYEVRGWLLFDPVLCQPRAICISQVHQREVSGEQSGIQDLRKAYSPVKATTWLSD